jgi:hypothetical protein
MNSTSTIDANVQLIHTTYVEESRVPRIHHATNLKVHAGTTLRVRTTGQHVPSPILPQRFNSTSQPCPRSIVLPELNSVSGPKTK